MFKVKPLAILEEKRPLSILDRNIGLTESIEQVNFSVLWLNCRPCSVNEQTGCSKWNRNFGSFRETRRIGEGEGREKRERNFFQISNGKARSI